MIVCLCHAVSDRSIRSAAAAGATVQDIARATGAGTSCGCCAEILERIVREEPGCRSPLHPCPGCPRLLPQRGHESAPTRDAA
jgi:bacterioferritin-associated ferredoxin